jgi:hypothetical protein
MQVVRLSMFSPRNSRSRSNSVWGLTSTPKAASVAFREVNAWATEQMAQIRETMGATST